MAMTLEAKKEEMRREPKVEKTIPQRNMGRTLPRRTDLVKLN
jgi:hypothetical protein